MTFFGTPGLGKTTPATNRRPAAARGDVVGEGERRDFVGLSWLASADGTGGARRRGSRGHVTPLGSPHQGPACRRHFHRGAELGASGAPA